MDDKLDHGQRAGRCHEWRVVLWLTKVEMSAMLGGAIDDTLDGAMDGEWYRVVVGKGGMVGSAGWLHGQEAGWCHG